LGTSRFNISKIHSFTVPESQKCFLREFGISFGLPTRANSNLNILIMKTTFKGVLKVILGVGTLCSTMNIKSWR